MGLVRLNLGSRGVRCAWAAAVLVALFFWVTLQVCGAGWVTHGDAGTLEWFVGHRSPGWTTAAREFTFFGNPDRATVIAAMAACWVGWRVRSFGPAVLILATVAGAALLGTALKRIVDRQRPPMDTRLVSESNMSYPSGHATATTALVAVLVLMYLSSGPSRRRAWAAIAVGAGVVVIMCATRLYLGVHWLSDVVGGVLLGGSVVAIAALIRARPDALRQR